MPHKTALIIAKTIKKIHKYRVEIDQLSIHEDESLIIPVVDLGATRTRVGFVLRHKRDGEVVGKPELLWEYSQMNHLKSTGGDLDKVVEDICSMLETGIEMLVSVGAVFPRCLA